MFQFFQISEFFLRPDLDKLMRIRSCVFGSPSKSKFSLYVLLSILKAHYHSLVNLHCKLSLSVMEVCSMVNICLFARENRKSVDFSNNIVHIEFIQIVDCYFIENLTMGLSILFIKISFCFGLF